MLPNKIKYIHLREFDRFGNTEHKGGKTVAWQLNDTANSIEYGFSLVHPDDRYVKATGRKVSDEFLKTNPITIGFDFVKLFLFPVINNYAMSKIKVDDLSSKLVHDVIMNHIQVAAEFPDADPIEVMEEVLSDEYYG